MLARLRVLTSEVHIFSLPTTVHAPPSPPISILHRRKAEHTYSRPHAAKEQALSDTEHSTKKNGTHFTGGVDHVLFRLLPCVAYSSPIIVFISIFAPCNLSRLERASRSLFLANLFLSQHNGRATPSLDFTSPHHLVHITVIQ